MKRLSSLRAHEVSLVRRGANRKPFLILKNQSNDDEVARMRTPVAGAQPPSQRLVLPPDENARIDAFLAARGARVQKDGEGLAPMDERLQAAFKAVYRILAPFKESIQEADVDALMDELGIAEGDTAGGDDGDPDDVNTDDAAAAKADDETTQGGSMADQDDLAEKAEGGVAWTGDRPAGVADDKHTAALKAAADAYQAAIKAEPAPAEKADEDEDEEADVDKSAVTKSAMAKLDEPYRSLIAGLVDQATKSNKALVAKSAELESKIRGMQDEKILKSLEDRVRSDYRHLALNAADTARVMKSMKERGNGEFEKYDATLRACNEAARVAKNFGGAGLFGTVGGAAASGTPSGSGESSDAGSTWTDGNTGTAEQQIERMVDSVVTKSGASVTKAAAWNQVLNSERGQALYTRYLEEKGG